MKSARLFLAGLFAASALASPCAAAIGTPVQIASGNITIASTTNITLPTSTDSPAGTAILGILDAPSNTTTVSGVTDTAGNVYTLASTHCSISGNAALYAFYIANPVDLPGPATATGSISTTVVTFTTNPGTLVVNQVITGSGVTTQPATVITGGISQWNGTVASATINNSQTVVSETLTISSSITATWATTSRKASMAAVKVSGLATSSVLDVQGACAGFTTTNTVSVTTGTLNNASEIAINAVDANGTTSTFTQPSGFTVMPGAGGAGIGSSNNEVHWGYDILSSTAAVTGGGSWVTNRTGTSNVWTFQAPGATSGHNLLLLMGVGE